MGTGIADTTCHVDKLTSNNKNAAFSFSPVINQFTNPKNRRCSGTVSTAAMAVEAAKPVMVIGIDNSEYAIAALEWTWDQLFSQTVRLHPFKLVVIHVKPSPNVFVGVSGPGRIVGSVETYQALDDDLKRKAASTVKIAREICAAKSVCDAEFEVEEGDARYVLCEAASKYRASVLVVGSRGHGAIKRALVGSVSDYCAHQAPCSVMIVKMKDPRNKNRA